MSAIKVHHHDKNDWTLTCGNAWNPSTYRDFMAEDAKGIAYRRLTGKAETTLTTFSKKTAQEWIESGWFVVKYNEYSGRWIKTYNDNAAPRKIRKALIN